jgi:hypothetical protein
MARLTEDVARWDSEKLAAKKWLERMPCSFQLLLEFSKQQKLIKPGDEADPRPSSESETKG